MKQILFFVGLLASFFTHAQAPVIADTSRIYLHDGKFSWSSPMSAVKTYIGAGTGTVTTFSAGNLSPLFTTSVSNATTTPALSFSLSTADENTYFGNPNGTAGAPTHTEAGSLSKTDDTNVTMTLGGSPTVSLLRNVTMTLGWSGQLATSRGGTGLGSIGSSKQHLRVNSGATALEYSSILSASGGIAAGTTSDPAASAILEAQSTTKGVLLTPMTTDQRDGITSPAADLLVSNTETDGIDMYNGTRWFRLTQASGTPSFTIGSGWGTGATSSIEGNDLAGKITVTSGTGSLTMTAFGTVTFNKAFPSGTKYAVIFSAANDNARGVAVSTWTYAASAGTSSFIADCNNSNILTRLQTSTAYQFYYRVVQYE